MSVSTVWNRHTAAWLELTEKTRITHLLRLSFLYQINYDISDSGQASIYKVGKDKNYAQTCNFSLYPSLTPFFKAWIVGFRLLNKTCF